MLKARGFKRASVLVMTVLCILFIITSALASGMGIGHDCAGEDCPICIFNSLRDDIFKALFFFAVAFLPVATLFIRGARSHNNDSAFTTETPVRLKVKLSD